MKNLYDILEIDRDASPEAIRKAYRKRVVKVHPDKPTGSREAYDEVALAYEVLSDPMRRVQYDATGELGNKEADNVTSELIASLDAIFNQVMTEIAARGLDAEYQNFIELMVLCATSAETETAKPLVDLRKSQEALQKLVDRFEVNEEGTPNHMATIVKRHLQGVEAPIKKINDTLASLRAAKLYLQGCRFRKVEPKIIAGFGFGGGPFTL